VLKNFLDLASEWNVATGRRKAEQRRRAS
jgi:hypothetical protein